MSGGSALRHRQASTKKALHTFMRQAILKHLLRAIGASTAISLLSAAPAYAQVQGAPQQNNNQSAKSNPSSSGEIVVLSNNGPSKIFRTEKNPLEGFSGSARFEILSSTMGADFRPYVGKIWPTIQKRWGMLIPEDALPPNSKSGSVAIEFAILKTGEVRNVKITQSTANIALDRAAYGAIRASAPLPELPEEFTGNALLLRCTFVYNPPKPAQDDAGPKK